MAKKRLLFIGDSITDCGHLWDFHEKALGDGYVRLISEYMERLDPAYEVINCGFNGFTAGDLLHYWQKNGKALRPDVVTVLVGGNDIAEYFDMDYTGGMWRFSNDYQRLLADIRRETEAKLILMEPFVFFHPPYLQQWHVYVREEIRLIQTMQKKYGAGYVPLYDGMMKACREFGENALTVDGMHLTRKGNELLAALWTQSVVKREKDGRWCVMGI